MRRTVRLSESDLERITKRIISENRNRETISLHDIQSAIVDSLRGRGHRNLRSVKKKIKTLSMNILEEFNDKLSYLEDNYEDELEDIINDLEGDVDDDE